MPTTFTYLPGNRPDGYDPTVGFGFAGNFGYWYFDFVAERSTFTDHWLTSINGGVRLNIGEQARFSDETDRTDQYIDFLGATLTPGGEVSGTIDSVLMGSTLGSFAGDYFSITAPRFSAAALNDGLADFFAAPENNVNFYDLLTRGVQEIIGLTTLDNHGGFADERLLVNVDFDAGDDVFYWAGGNRNLLTIDMGAGQDRLVLYSDVAATIDLANGTSSIGSATAQISGVVSLFLGNGNDWARGTSSAEYMAGNDGRDILIGLGGSDQLFGDQGNDILIGGKGKDWLKGGEGDDILRGGEGRDMADFKIFGANQVIPSVVVNLKLGIATGALIGRDKLYDIEDVTSGFSHDRVTGDNRANLIDTGAGDDVLSGKGGRDTLAGGRGDDILTGGRGRDVFVFDGLYGSDVVRDFTTGQDRLDLSALSWATDLQAVLARATDTANGLSIHLGTELGRDATLLLNGVDLVDIGAGDLIYFT